MLARLLALCAAGLVVFSGCGGGSDVATPDQLPLAPGTRLADHEVRPADDGFHTLFVLIADDDAKSPAVVRHDEIAYLRRQGWHVHHHYQDGGWSVTSPDKTVWAYVGFGARGHCGFDDQTSRASICASLGPNRTE